MNARQKAHAELQHALDALGDGSGHDCWGPGPVGEVLWAHHSEVARAFDDASAVVWRQYADVITSSVGRADVISTMRPAFISAMRKLAPVILDIRLDALGVE